MTNQNCDILGTEGFFIQLSLALVCFGVLIYKRIRERPKRQWKVWWLDTSKQGFSQIIAHMLNVALAIHLSQSDECVSQQYQRDFQKINRYLATLLLDTTLGVVLCYILLKLSELILENVNQLNLCSGNYFLIIMPDDQVKRNEMNDKDKVPSQTNLLKPIIKIDYKSWFLQLVIWQIIVVLSKLFLYLIQSTMGHGFQNIFGFLSSFGQTLKLIVVMMLIPALMNSLQFWVQDNFLKKTQFTVQEKKYVMSEMYVDEKQLNFEQLENYVRQDKAGSSHNLQLPTIELELKKKHNGYQKADLGDND